MPKAESKIQLEICRYLRTQNYLFWRFDPSTYVPSLGRYVKHEYVANGLPDLMILVKNKMVGLEVKKPNGSKISPHQLLMQKRFQALGHDFHIVKSVDEVIELGL